MYKLHLILKYLRKRRIAWCALAAVTLCTTMVLVVISVMGGWMQMFRQAYHGLNGDIIITRHSLAGFEHYQELLDQVRALPDVKAAMPVVSSFGLLNVLNRVPTGVQVVGLDLKQAQQITDFTKGLNLQPDKLEAMAKTARDPADAEVLLHKALTFPSFDRLYCDASYLARLPSTATRVSYPGMIVGYGVIGLPRNEKTGQVEHDPQTFDVETHGWAMLTPLVTGEGGAMPMQSITPQPFWIVDDSRTGIWQIDNQVVYVQFEVLQHLLKMDAQEYTTEATGDKKLYTEPRAKEIQIKLRDGLETARGAQTLSEIKRIVDEFKQKYFISERIDQVTVMTWDQQQAEFLNAVEHEKVLLLVLFAIISVVAIFMIFCIFYMIVQEKTRDIGILKAVGASSQGVAGIFVGYGLVIGVLGGFSGLLAAYLIVHNINGIHAWVAKLTGTPIWSGKTYLFDTIPNQMSPRDAVWIVGVAIFSSVMGALLPAWRAAQLKPVESLRWE